MVREEQSYFSSLRYVTLGDAWECGKPAIALWLFISAVVLVVTYFGSAVAPVALDLGIPAGALWFAGACLFAWVLRGEEVGFRLPELTPWQWLISSLAIGGVLAILNATPWWFVIPLTSALIFVSALLHTLVATGGHRRASIDLGECENTGRAV